MACENCGRPLHRTQWEDQDRWKSCPRCSQAHGTEHVFYRYPDAFGTTPNRATDRHPEGPQSHCQRCRGGNDIPFEHESVKHSVAEYVRGMAHTNGVESFWSMLKRAHKGTFHKMSPKHLDRYVQEFAGKHNARDMDTAAQMAAVAAGMVGKRLMYKNLIADNGLSSGARSA